MLATYLLSLREGLEAALIIGIVLGAVSKIRRTDLVPTVWLGTLSAIGVSILTAIVLTTFGMSLEDPGEAIFEGITMLLAAGILTWMIFWMSKQARFLKSEIEAGMNKAASAGKSAVFWLAFIAVVREGRTANGWVRYAVKSISNRPGLYTVTFSTPCGAQTIPVTVK